MSVLCNSAVLGAGAVDTGDIGHSLRGKGTTGNRLSKTFGARTSGTTGTLSMWLKRSTLGAIQYVIAASNYEWVRFQADDKLHISNPSGTPYWISTQVFRDPTAFIHLVVAWDTTQATASNRCRVWINNVEITAWDSNPAITQNSTFSVWNTSGNVGTLLGSATFDQNFGGYGARMCWVDGSYLTPSSFGYFNTEINEWVSKSASAVKAVVDAGGTNSFMLDFDDATSLTTLGYDKSSKGNNWTLNNFSLTAGTTYDHMLDVPGNSFATWNPLQFNISSLAYANLNLTTASTLCVRGVPDLRGREKSYFEFPSAGTNYTGWGVQDERCTSISAAGNVDAYIWGVYNTGTMWMDLNTASSNIGVAPPASGGAYCVAFDAATGKLWLGYAASGTSTPTWIGGGDPAAGTTPTATLSLAYAIFPHGDVVTGGGSQTITFNAGQYPATANSAWRSEAGGYFHCVPPTGYKALCQRNLPDPAILNPKNGFVSVIATEDNIYSTLAAARSGWTDYVDILKNRAASESWAWQFSHDSSNEYAVSASSLVRQTKRTQSGSNNWVGYSIRIGATYGTAAGSVSHTNGVATTITHNVGKSARQMILLFNRAGGSAVPVYHPDLTSGELLDLCTTAADAASTAITSVGTNSFQIGSATATGTYDYLVCSEISQFFDLGKWTGNASADGVYYDAGHKPKMLYAKALSTTDDHRVYDDLRPGYNVQGGVVLANTNAAETTAAEMDITAFGMKARITTTPNAAQTYVTASWASSSGKYSLGR